MGEVSMPFFYNEADCHDNDKQMAKEQVALKCLNKALESTQES